MKGFLIFTLIFGFANNSFAWTCEAVCAGSYENRGSYSTGSGSTNEEAKRAATVACNQSGGYIRWAHDCVGSSGYYSCSVECLTTTKFSTNYTGYGSTQTDARQDVTRSCTSYLESYKSMPNYIGWTSVGACRP
jgi:hypothetical protein